MLEPWGWPHYSSSPLVWVMLLVRAIPDLRQKAGIPRIPLTSFWQNNNKVPASAFLIRPNILKLHNHLSPS
jgi:hypothetical protein